MSKTYTTQYVHLRIFNIAVCVCVCMCARVASQYLEPQAYVAPKLARELGTLVIWERDNKGGSIVVNVNRAAETRYHASSGGGYTKEDREVPILSVHKYQRWFHDEGRASNHL